MAIATLLLALIGCGDPISSSLDIGDSAEPRRPKSSRHDSGDAPLADTAGDTGVESSDTDEPADDDPPDVEDRLPADPGSGLSHICKEWTFSGAPDGWTMSTDLLPTTTQPPDAARFTAGADPYLWIAHTESLNECTVIDVVLKVTGGASTWQLFWEREGDGEFSESRSRQFQLWEDEGWHRYVFDLRDHELWNGMLSRIRLDPRSGAGSVELRSIRLMKPEPKFPPAPNMADLNWLHTDVSSWSQTSALADVSVSDTQICLDHSKASVWETRTCCDGVEVAANPWVLIWNPDLTGHGGQWYSATWEWMRPGQICKSKSSVAADHIKQSPYHPTSGWRPSSGEVLYFMVSGLARGSERNHTERSNLVEVRW